MDERQNQRSTRCTATGTDGSPCLAERFSVLGRPRRPTSAVYRPRDVCSGEGSVVRYGEKAYRPKRALEALILEGAGVFVPGKNAPR